MDSHGQHDITDFFPDRKILEKQISNVELRQQELQNHIVSIETVISEFEQLVQIEKKKTTIEEDKIKYFRVAIAKNIELVRELYETYRGYEEVKLKYYKQITDLTMKAKQMIEIDIKRLNTKMDDITSTNIMQVMSVIAKSVKEKGSDSELIGNSMKELSCDPSLEL